MSKLNLSEEFICRIWENPAYYSGLKTTDNLPVEIISPGVRNPDAGPDYLNSVAVIGDRSYSGSIEIHKNSSDWYKHSHRKDPRYSEVVLHVAMFDDSDGKQTFARRSREVHTLILSQFLTKSIREIWKELIIEKRNSSPLPCFPLSLKQPSALKSQIVRRFGELRLLRKSHKTKERISALSETGSALGAEAQTLFEYVCEALGYSKNKEPFMKLARGLEPKLFASGELTLTETDALIFGKAGFVQGLRHGDEYVKSIKTIWQEKFLPENLSVMNKSEWTFFRLRPSNFPVARLAYASAFLHRLQTRDTVAEILSAFTDEDNPSGKLEELLSGIDPSSYWDLHYDFGKLRAAHTGCLGEQRSADIVANVFIPFALAASSEDKRIRNSYFSMKSRGGKSAFLRKMESELGFNARYIFEEQGLIELHGSMCSKNKCEECELRTAKLEEAVTREPVRIILY